MSYVRKPVSLLNSLHLMWSAWQSALQQGRGGIFYYFNSKGTGGKTVFQSSKF